MCFHFFDQWSITHLDICCRNLHCRLSVCVSVCVCVSHRCLRSCARSLERFRSWGQTSEQKQLFTLHHVEIFSPPRNIEHTLGPRVNSSILDVGHPGRLLCETMDLQNILSKHTPYKTQQIYNTNRVSPWARRSSHCSHKLNLRLCLASSKIFSSHRYDSKIY